jgi:glycosyltransferase involved in cell wall biosynthesis
LRAASPRQWSGMSNMQKDKPFISVVTPVYGCNSCLGELYRRLKATLAEITANYEIVFVNDASPDNAWATICALAEKDRRVKGINLSRNFGQHRAITAGLDFADGEWVVVMDCDLQDRPEEILRLYRKALEGYDVVFARRHERQDRLWKRWTSICFYRVLDFFTEHRSDHTVANFSISSRTVVDNFRNMREQNRIFPLFLQWMGFNTATIDVEHSKRYAGKSSYTLSKLFHLAIDTIVSQSNKPLRLSIQFGFLISFASLLYGLWLMYRYFFLAQPVPGWTSVMVSIYFIGGLLFANLGILGLYIGKVFDEVKNRPLYVIRDKVGFDKDKGREVLKQVDSL